MKSISKVVVKKLIKKRIRISIAESCTGGLLSGAITSVSGSSKIFTIGLVAYSNQSKIKILQVSKKIIKKYSKKMIQTISKLCEINPNQINIKGKTTEKLGLIGKGKAIASEVIASVIKHD